MPSRHALGSSFSSFDAFVEDFLGQGGLSGTGYTREAHKTACGNFDVDPLEIVFCSTVDLDPLAFVRLLPGGRGMKSWPLR